MSLFCTFLGISWDFLGKDPINRTGKVNIRASQKRVVLWCCSASVLLGAPCFSAPGMVQAGLAVPCAGCGHAHVT